MQYIKFLKVREVNSPKRAHATDAGIDFFTPTDLTLDQLAKANADVDISLGESSFDDIKVTIGENGYVSSIRFFPGARVIIPSGIRVLIEPKDSALFVANKSGISTKKGLIYTAQVVDSEYTGEIHLCVVNTSSDPITILMGNKLVQLIHMPVYLTTPEEITKEQYDSFLDNSSRGSGWQGSTGD